MFDGETRTIKNQYQKEPKQLHTLEGSRVAVTTSEFFSSVSNQKILMLEIIMEISNKLFKIKNKKPLIIKTHCFIHREVQK